MLSAEPSENAAIAPLPPPPPPPPAVIARAEDDTDIDIKAVGVTEIVGLVDALIGTGGDTAMKAVRSIDGSCDIIDDT